MKKITTAVLVGVMGLSLTACTSPEPTPEPKPTYSAVPTTAPAPVQSAETPLATTIGGAVGYPIEINVYDIAVWNAEDGCDCSAPGDASTELYPAGSTAWAVRVELATPPWTFRDGVDMTGVQLTTSWGSGAPVPVEIPEGESMASALDLGWGFASAQDPALLEWGATRSFLLTVYVPRGAVALELDVDIPPIPGQRNAMAVTNELDVELPQSVIDVLYANSNGD